MGKWAEVPCICADRVPIRGSDPQFDRPHRNKRRLTKKQKQEVDEWQRTTEGMYRCGHRNGMVVELWPGDIIEISHLIAEAFHDDHLALHVFRKVGDWRSYKDDLLLIPPGEAEVWLLGLKRLMQAFRDTPHVFARRLLCKVLEREMSQREDLRSRLNQLAGSFAAVGWLKENAQLSEAANPDSTSIRILNALADAARLCSTSSETGSPILLHW